MEQQLSEAFTIMVTGMIAVFVFLTLLLFAMGVLRRVAATDELAQEPTRKTPAKQSDSATSSQLRAAITTAVHAYRRDRE